MQLEADTARAAARSQLATPDDRAVASQAARASSGFRAGGVAAIALRRGRSAQQRPTRAIAHRSGRAGRSATGSAARSIAMSASSGSSAPGPRPAARRSRLLSAAHLPADMDRHAVVAGQRAQLRRAAHSPAPATSFARLEPRQHRRSISPMAMPPDGGRPRQLDIDLSEAGRRRWSIDKIDAISRAPVDQLSIANSSLDHVRASREQRHAVARCRGRLVGRAAIRTSSGRQAHRSADARQCRLAIIRSDAALRPLEVAGQGQHESRTGWQRKAGAAMRLSRQRRTPARRSCRPG